MLCATVALDVALGIVFGLADRVGAWHGVYCATGTATTVGCDAPISGWLPHVLSAMMMVTIVPLFASVFAFFTTGLTADHVDGKAEEIKDHVTEKTGVLPKVQQRQEVSRYHHGGYPVL